MNLAEMLAYYPAVTLALAAMTLLLLRRDLPARWGWSVSAIGVVGFLAVSWMKYQIPYDYKLFWLCGKDVLAGVNYYAIDPRSGRQLVLNPPTALPLFELFSLCPLRKGAKVWTLVNTLASLGLVPLAYRVLQGHNGYSQSCLSASTLGVLSVLVALSPSCLSNLALGQLSILTTFAIFLALRAQDRGWSLMAGVWLTIASIKVVTMLPFLVFFLNKRDIKTWCMMACMTLWLCGMTGTFANLPGRLGENIRSIRAMAEVGRVNDYSYDGPSHLSMIALDHAFYRLGMTDRGRIALLQAVVVAAIGLMAARVGRDPRCPRAGATSLVALYSTIFLYHRTYDAVILALPLVFCVQRTRDRPPREARMFALAAALMVVVLFMNQRFLAMMEASLPDHECWGRIARAAILPAASWSVLLAMACVGVGLRRGFGPAPALQRED